MGCSLPAGPSKRHDLKAGQFQASQMYCSWKSAADLAFLSLKSSSDELVSCFSPPINVLGFLGMPAGTVLLLCATVAWILVFTLVPTLLIFAWMVLQPYRLWLFLKSRMTGRDFLS
jgi:hypothetical protein